MVALAERLIDAGCGTAESTWLPWLAHCGFERIAVDELVPHGSRAVIVAPHPDDEVLAAGGLLAMRAALGRPSLVVAVTDGEASHSGSSRWTPQALREERTAETRHALDTLGLRGPHSDVLRLGFGDGGVAGAVDALAECLERILRPSDVVLTTWRFDGHPDHEATAHACLRAERRTRNALIEVPVWAWHWAEPDDPRLPWQRARLLALDADAARRKCAAVQAFRTQLVPDASTGRAAVLRPSIVQRAARPFEVFFA